MRFSGRDSATRFQTKSTPHVEFSPQTPHDVAVASSMQVDLLSLESTMVFHTLTRFNERERLTDRERERVLEGRALEGRTPPVPPINVVRMPSISSHTLGVRVG